MDNQPASEPQEYLMRGLLRAYYWMDESLQNGLSDAGMGTRTRTQTMILINVSNGVTRAAALARILGISRQAVQQQVNELEKEDIVRLPAQESHLSCRGFSSYRRERWLRDNRRVARHFQSRNNKDKA